MIETINFKIANINYNVTSLDGDSTSAEDIVLDQSSFTLETTINFKQSFNHSPTGVGVGTAAEAKVPITAKIIIKDKNKDNILATLTHSITFTRRIAPSI